MYNQVWGYADIPSHFLGGLITWVIFNEVVLEASRTYKRNWSRRKIAGISFFALALVGIGWEFMEVFLQPSMPWLYETLLNKIRDVTMELLGFCTGILRLREQPHGSQEPKITEGVRRKASESQDFLNPI